MEVDGTTCESDASTIILDTGTEVRNLRDLLSPPLEWSVLMNAEVCAAKFNISDKCCFRFCIKCSNLTHSVTEL